MANDSIQTGGPPYPNFQWPYPNPPSTALQLVAVGSDAPHWTGGHMMSNVATNPAAQGAGGSGEGLGGNGGTGNNG